MYDPKAGRWAEQDPISFAGGDSNLYRFCGNDPVNHTDPSGEAMIVDGKRYTKENKNDFAKDYPQLLRGETNREILAKMILSSHEYKYSSEVLNFELMIRSMIVSEVQAQDELHKDKKFIFGDITVNPNSKCWKQVRAGHITRTSLSAADAVRELFNPDTCPVNSECKVALQMIYLKAILDVIGREKFDQLYKVENLGTTKNSFYALPFVQGDPVTGKRQQFPDYFPGDWMYINNPDCNTKKHPAWIGENVIRMPGRQPDWVRGSIFDPGGTQKVVSDRFYGHDLGIRSEAAIRDDLNKRRLMISNQADRILPQDAYLVNGAYRVDFEALYKAVNK